MKEEKMKKRKWINSAFYLDEPFEEDEIEKALKDEFVRKDLFSLIQLLWEIKNNNT